MICSHTVVGLGVALGLAVAGLGLSATQAAPASQGIVNVDMNSGPSRF